MPAPKCARVSAWTPFYRCARVNATVMSLGSATVSCIIGLALTLEFGMPDFTIDSDSTPEGEMPDEWAEPDQINQSTFEVEPVEAVPETDRTPNTLPNVDFKLTEMHHAFAALLNVAPQLTAMNRVAAALPDFSPHLTAMNRVVAALPDFSPHLTAMNRVVAALPDFSPHLTVMNRVVAALPDFSPHLTAMNRVVAALPDFSPHLTAMNRVVATLASFTPQIPIIPRISFSSIYHLASTLLETLAPIRERVLFENTGWFPHSTFPVELLDQDPLLMSLYCSISKTTGRWLGRR